VVDDFGIKYKGKEHADHLIAAIREKYILKIDWTGHKYVGLHIAFDRTARICTLSMPGYISNALARFNIQPSKRSTDSPAIYTAPVYGKHPQLPTVDNSPPLPPERAQRIQEITGVILYYARAIDSPLMCTVSKIASMQSKATEAAEALAERLLQHVASYPNATVVYHASDMILKVHSDASYLSETAARSRAGGAHFLGNRDDSTLPINGLVECISVIIPSVCASACESEYASLYINGVTAETLRTTLEDLGYPQDDTEIVCDNECATGISNGTCKQRKSKAIDMRYHWIRDRVSQKHFRVTWRRGCENLADFFTKTHPIHHHKAQRLRYVADRPSIPSTPTSNVVERVC
jgi:hypothetical protein